MFRRVSVGWCNWMAWCKTNLRDFFRWDFFSSKVPEFLHVLFNLVVKHAPVFFGWFPPFVSEKNKTDLSDFHCWTFYLQKNMNFVKRRPKKEKHFSDCSNTMMQRTMSENALFPLCCVHCAHFDIKKRAYQPKKVQGIVLVLEKHMQKFRHFWRKK